MKNYIPILCAALIAVLASCSSDSLPTTNHSDLRQVTIDVVTNTPATRPTAPAISRYAISVWEDEEYAVPAEGVFMTGNDNTASNATGTFAMILNSTKTYYCLFWADNGAGYALGDNTLRNVTLTEGHNVSEAFCGKTQIPAGTSTTYTANLKRAVAKVTLKETGEIPAGNTITVKINHHTAYTVRDDTDTGDQVLHTLTWTTTAKSGTADAPVQLNDEDIFVLAPVTRASLRNITFQCNDEGEVMVSNVPLQANYNTNIKGHYTTVSDQTFNVNVDNKWETGNLAPETRGIHH